MGFFPLQNSSAQLRNGGGTYNDRCLKEKGSNAIFGIGLSSVLSVDSGFGIGFRGRVSNRVNCDFSLAIGMGFTGFVLQGRDEASFIFDPQLSGIINLPQGENLEYYLLAGIGAYVPLTQASSNASGPTIHFGGGGVKKLVNSAFFFEVNPAIVIGQTRVEFVLPFRAGIIFINANS